MDPLDHFDRNGRLRGDLHDDHLYLFRGDRRLSPAAIHNYPPDIQEGFVTPYVET